MTRLAGRVFSMKLAILRSILGDAAPPVLRVLLGPARLRHRERVLAPRRGPTTSPSSETASAFETGGPDVEADEAQAPVPSAA